jgi:hypothetical protein
MKQINKLLISAVALVMINLILLALYGHTTIRQHLFNLIRFENVQELEDVVFNISQEVAVSVSEDNNNGSRSITLVGADGGNIVKATNKLISTLPRNAQVTLLELTVDEESENTIAVLNLSKKGD